MKKKKFKVDDDLIELFKEELINQCELFQQYLEEIKNKGISTLLLDELIRISHSIKGAAKLVSIDAITHIGSTLEIYFKALKDKKILLKEKDLKIVFLILSFLEKASKSSIPELENLLDNLDSTNKYIEDLKKATNGGYEDHNNENELIDNFLFELRRESENLAEGMTSIRLNFDDIERLEKMSLISENIKNSANKINLSIVMQVGEALENCFKAAYNQQLTWTQGHLDLLVESIEFLRKLSLCNSFNMTSWLAKNEKGIEAIAAVILAISREASAIPPRKKEILKNIPENEKVNKEDISESFITDASMMDLFYGELEQRVIELNEGILTLEVHSGDEKALESLMRAAHSLKGAARIVQLNDISRIAHILEDFFSLLEKEKIELTTNHIDELLKAVDLFSRLSQVPYYGINEWINAHRSEIENVIDSITFITENPTSAPKIFQESKGRTLKAENLSRIQKDLLKEFDAEKKKLKAPKKEEDNQVREDSFLRVSAKNLNKLMGLAGESLVESGWLIPFAKSLATLKHGNNSLTTSLDKLYEIALPGSKNQQLKSLVEKLKIDLYNCQQNLNERIVELDLYIQRQNNLSNRLYSEVINSRMRPFADGIEGFPRLVRDLAKQLKKKVQLIIEGKTTQVDREILEKLEAPLNHLLRNAVDHGIESVEERIAAHKNEVGTIKIEASHKAGMLSIIVSDDGRGVNIDHLKKSLIDKGFISSSMADKLSVSELLEFMFLPGFSTSEKVTDVSGRGIGLNVVQNIVEEVGGTIHASLNTGLVIELQLPLTLSVIRALLVEISGEPYAFPLARLNKVLTLSKNDVQTIENRYYFSQGKKNIGLIQGYQFLELPPSNESFEDLSVIIISDQINDYGVIVDRFLEEKELVVQELDPFLGKVQDISGGAFMENGSPVLIIDVEDMIKTIDKLLAKVNHEEIKLTIENSKIKKPKILVVEDSLTFSELETRILEQQGFDVVTATNGLEAWNEINNKDFELIITDLDIPKLNGIDLIKRIKSNLRYKDIPILVISHNEKEESRIESLTVGADFYMRKDTFSEKRVVDVVTNLLEKSKSI